MTSSSRALVCFCFKGRVEKDMDADFVVLDGDPAADVRNFAKVAYTIRGGKVIYSAK